MAQLVPVPTTKPEERLIGAAGGGALQGGDVRTETKGAEKGAGQRVRLLAPSGDPCRTVV